MAIIDTLSIRFESEAKKALDNVKGLDTALSKLATIVGKLSGAKISLGITDATAHAISSFNSAIKRLDLERVKEFASAMKKIPKVSIGIGEKTGSSLTSFSNALKTFDYDKAKEFGELTQGFKSVNLGGISEKGALGIRSFNAALAGFDVVRLSLFSELVSNFPKGRLSLIPEKTGDNLRSLNSALSEFDVYRFSMVSDIIKNTPGVKFSISKDAGDALLSLGKGLNELDIAKFAAFRNIADGFKGFSLGISTKSAVALSDFATALNTINLSAFREFANIVSFDLKPVKTGLTLDTAKNIAYFGVAINSLDMTKLHAFAWALERIGNAAEKIRGVSTAMERLNDGFNQMEQSSKRAGKSAHNTTNILKRMIAPIKGLFKSIGRIAFYRAIRSAIKAVTKGFSEGIKALYHWSEAWGTSFAPAMDQLATATKYLRNGFASMFSPLIEWGVPILDRLIDKFVEFFNFVQEGFARLTGAPTWNRALKVAAKYDEETQNATKSAKELKNQLMGFDELNVLNTDNGSNSGKDKDEEDYASMFELVATTPGGVNVGKILADAINSVFDDPDKFTTYGENIAKWISNGFDESINFVVALDTGNIGESVANFVSGFNTQLAEEIKNKDFGEAQVQLSIKLAEMIDGLLVEGDNGHIKIIDSLKKLISSIVASIPSIIIGSFESTAITLDPILRGLGLTKLADKLIEWKTKLGSARKAYEQSKGTALSSLFQYIDSGNWEPQTTRGFDYDPTQDNGRSFDSNGAVVGGSIISSLFGGKSIFDDEDMEGFKFIKGIIEMFKKFYEDNKGTLDTLFTNIALTAQALAPLIKAIAKIVGTQMLTEFVMMTNVFLQSLTPALESLNGVLSILNGLMEGFFGDSDKGFDSFLSGLENISASILRLIVSPFKLVLTIMDGISAAFAALLPKGKVKDFVLAENRLIKLSAEYLDKIPDSVKKTPEERAQEQAYYEAEIEDLKNKGILKDGNNLPSFWSIFGVSPLQNDDPNENGGGNSDVLYNGVALPFKLKPPEEKENKSVLNNFWTSIKRLWGKDKWVGVNNRITGITQSIRDGWDTFKLKWGERFANIRERVTNITSAAKDGWAAFKDKWGERFANVNSRITNITSGIKDGWETFKGIWGTKRYANATSNIIGIGDSITNGWTSFINTWGNRSADVTTTLTTNTVQNKTFLDNMWKGVEKDWGNKSLWITLNAGGLTLPKPSGGGNNSLPNTFNLPVQWRARGGYLPNSYSLYGMGENGVPEILGTVGGRSAVAGGAEITGIREAIYEQGQREETLLRNLINAVNSKDLTLVANSSTGRWVNRALSAYAGVTG